MEKGEKKIKERNATRDEQKDERKKWWKIKWMKEKCEKWWKKKKNQKTDGKTTKHVFLGA